MGPLSLAARQRERLSRASPANGAGVFGLENVSAASDKGRAVFLVMVMAVGTFVAFVEALVLRSLAPLVAALAGWAFVALYIMLSGTLFQRAGRGIGAITLPSGDSTPSVNQHSNIQALVARGELAKAAEAFRAAIAADPQDLVACEQLGRLALGELKDCETALFAYREAERRCPDPRRKLGFALMVAGIYRENLRDPGRAAVELGRILARYPDAPNADALRAEREQLKAIHFEGA
jgi:tetratricopeptide (TPR) repeat protein